jgi:SAM-dependent methyltransferase
MDETKLTRLAALPPLEVQEELRLSCKICGGVAPTFDVIDFQKVCSLERPYMFGLSRIPVYYYRCTECAFLFTDFTDDWSIEEFNRFIYNQDYIKVDGDYAGARPRRDGESFRDLLRPYTGLSVLDYGGGTGVLAEVLREAGHDAECYDPFSSPARPGRRFDLITCMEVIEHSPDPVSSLRDMADLLKPDGCILIGTGLQPDEIEILRANWWYIAPRNGHVSLQSTASLVSLGRAVGMIAHPSAYLHGFANAAPSPVSSALLERIGRPMLDVFLSAPDAYGRVAPALTSDLSQWQDIEEASFRWTARSEIVWRWTPPIGDCNVQLRLSAYMEMEQNFLSRARLLIDDREVPLELRGLSFRAVALLETEAPVTIRLITPPPPRPRDIHGTNDRRHLGIAVRLRAARADG